MEIMRRASSQRTDGSASTVAARGGPAAAQVKGSGGCSVSDRESPWVTLLKGMSRGTGLASGCIAASHECPMR